MTLSGTAAATVTVTTKAAASLVWLPSLWLLQRRSALQ
jgi:hypothetical protein